MRGIFAVAAFVTIATLASPAAAQPKHKAPKTDAEMIANAMSAAPKAVAQEATIIAMDEHGKMRVLREGKGAFTCMPDNPMSPGNDPMCLDKPGMEWAKAWMSKSPPPAGIIGFGYMLAGGSDASNDDPHATKPAPGKKWVDTGPHVMILNPGAMADSYPKTADDPKKPYVMWPGTPWQHIMIPVR
jgi:hypothetical protein